jgi:hypothetical protein
MKPARLRRAATQDLSAAAAYGAELIDPALPVSGWLERVGEAQRDSHGETHREQSAVRVGILDGKPLERGRGRMDGLLRRRQSSPFATHSSSP